ncbi:2-hydroxyacid dehydrogenase [Proteiniclasticum sp. C24MP]|uniref:2-hydroxyacid dehydrogenase n=1 Tax=Proteiniclasticum sp. C24MP TaxID=3374101 RepID=UPI003754303A
MKLFIRAPFTSEKIEELRELFTEIVYEPWTKNGQRYYEDDMIEALRQHQPDVLITELDKVTDKVLRNYKNLKAVGDCRAVPANIEVDACTKNGIPVICTPGRNAQAVAEMLVGLLLSYMRNIIPSVNWVKKKKWVEGTTPYHLWMGNELSGKTIGFVGFGAVGQAAARILEAFGCKITYYDPFVKIENSNYEKKELADLFGSSDIISLHLPSIPETEKMIDLNLMKSVKKNAILINTARSSVIDMEALETVIKDGVISGVILDVLDNEPPSDEDLRLIKYENVLITPHICGATYEVTDHQSTIMTERLKKYFQEGLKEGVLYNYRDLGERDEK